MKHANFSNASTFSHVGRHASELKYLLRNSKPKKILDVGSGCFEPILLAEMLPTESTVYAIDVNQEICDVLDALVRGKKVKLSDLSTIICNKSDDGTPRVNTDLTDPAILARGLCEMQAAGLDPTSFVEDGRYKSPGNGAKIVVINSDIERYCPQHQKEFDFVYAGVLLLNIAKVTDVNHLTDITRSFVDTLRGETIGIGTNLSGLYGDKNTPKVLENSGASITELLVDHLVKVKIGGEYKLFSGHCISATKDNKNSTITSSTIEERISNNPILSQIPTNRFPLRDGQLQNYLSERNGEIILAALKREHSFYDVWTVDTKQVGPLLPAMNRKPLGMIPTNYD